MNKSILLMTLIALFPAASLATDWEISQLASQLENASQDLSRSSKGMRGFTSVSNNAKRLSDKAEKLADSIARGRSNAYIRNRYSDVSRYYQRLENAFLKANRNYGSRFVGSDFELVANLYDGLSYQFYGDNYYQSNRTVVPYYSFGQSYRYNPPYYSNPRIFVFPQTNRGYTNQRRGSDRRGQRERYQHDRRSNVLQRQYRNDRLGNDRPGDNRPNSRMRNDRNDNDAGNNGRRDQRSQQRGDRSNQNESTANEGRARSQDRRVDGATSRGNGYESNARRARPY